MESDIQLTADGVPVLAHDDAVGHWPRRGRISQMSAAEVPDNVITLEQLVDAVGSGYDLSLDLKASRSYVAVADIAQRRGLLGRLWVCGSLPEVLGWRREDVIGGVRYVLSCRARDLRRVAGGCRELKDLGVDVVNLPYRDWTVGRAAAVHDAGLLAFGWDAHNRRRVSRLVALGCDGIYGDDVDALLAGARRATHR